MRGRGALSGGSTRGARGAGAEPSAVPGGCGFESFGELPKMFLSVPSSNLNAANKRSEQKSDDKRRDAIVHFLVAPPWIAPQLRAQGHVEARRQMVLPIRGHAAKDRLAIRRDAAARRQWLAVVGAGAAKVLDLLWHPASRDARSRDEAEARSGGGEARDAAQDALCAHLVRVEPFALRAVVEGDLVRVTGLVVGRDSAAPTLVRAGFCHQHSVADTRPA